MKANLDAVHARISESARRAGRDPSEITLVAVTKRNPSELVRPLVELGALDLGENYPQELWKKAEDLSDLTAIRWHLIGHLQGNKARKTLPLVRMIHAVDSLKLLATLDALAAESSAPPRVCLQVNTSGEAAKHGWDPEEIVRDADAVAGCQRIPIVGLMTMAALGTDDESARPSFARLRAVRDELQTRIGRPFPVLSMGMSGDFEAAIAEGATHVRIGSALFEGVEW